MPSELRAGDSPQVRKMRHGATVGEWESGGVGETCMTFPRDYAGVARDVVHQSTDESENLDDRGQGCGHRDDEDA